MICEICGKEFDTSHYGKPYENICSSECFNDKFWLEKIEDKDNLTIVDGNCYWFNKHNPIKNTNTQWNGFAGRQFIIKYNNGETYITNNLSHNGVIPDKFRDILCDNAEFV